MPCRKLERPLNKCVLEQLVCTKYVTDPSEPCQEDSRLSGRSAPDSREGKPCYFAAAEVGKHMIAKNEYSLPPYMVHGAATSSSSAISSKEGSRTTGSPGASWFGARKPTYSTVLSSSWHDEQRGVPSEARCVAVLADAKSVYVSSFLWYSSTSSGVASSNGRWSTWSSGCFVLASTRSKCAFSSRTLTSVGTI